MHLNQAMLHFQFAKDFRPQRCQPIDQNGVATVADAQPNYLRARFCPPSAISKILVFGDNDQFKVTGTPILSNDSVQATLLSSYRSANTASPVISSNRIFFGFERGEYSGVYQLTPSTNVEGQ